MYLTALLILSPTTNERGGRGSWPERRIASLIAFTGQARKSPADSDWSILGVWRRIGPTGWSSNRPFNHPDLLAHPEPKALAVDPFRENLKNICLFFFSFFPFFSSV